MTAVVPRRIKPLGGKVTSYTFLRNLRNICVSWVLTQATAVGRYRRLGFGVFGNHLRSYTLFGPSSVPQGGPHAGETAVVIGYR